MDYNLLRLLEGDCTLSKKQLAAMVGTSADRVEETIQEYEKAGVIQGYKAVIDWDATDRQDVTALIEVKVEPQRDDG
ncbi:MAG: Lrp/AsnC family transcriptional regulator, partial [Oscillospiraceae bacterium]|nr:Lrp/AsnC family transcriptional regulator [Oscillospiraceae bacterium]